MALIFDSLLLDFMSVLLAFLAILYFYTTRNFNYWEKQGAYSISPTPFFGSISNILLLRESIACWLARNYKETANKRFFGVYFMDKPALVVRDLELLKNVFVKDAHVFLDRALGANEDLDPLVAKNLFGQRGKKWKHLRVKLSPTFTSGKMKKMFYIVDECGKQLSTCLGKNASLGTNVDVKETMARYTTDVIALCAFGINTDAQRNSNSEFRTVMKRFFDRNSVAERIIGVVIFIYPVLLRLFKMRLVAIDIADFLRKMFWDVVEQRKKSGTVRNDFIDLLIKLMDEGEVRADDAKDLEEIKQDNSFNSLELSKKDNLKFEMKGDDFVAQVFVFLVAGFETSSSVLSYTLYELALNPDVQEKLRSDITTTLEKHGGKLTYEVMTDMTYLEMVISESLRKYPTLAFLDRVSSSDYKIPGTDVTIKKGMQVMIPVLGIHHDPSYYPDPEKFDPERFSAENKSKRPQFAHIPFGEGPRTCIGMRFGQMQVKTALIHILTSYQVSTCAETPKPPLHYKPGSVVHSPLEDIVLAFHKLP